VSEQPESEIPQQAEAAPDTARAKNAKQAPVAPTKREIRDRVAYESKRRTRLAVPATAGGVLYLLGAITLSGTLKQVPTVGLIQGAAPAIDGQVNPAVSPRAAEIRFYDHHAFGLIAGAALSAAAIAVLLVVLLFLFDAARFRRPETAPIARPLILIGGIGLSVLTVAGEIVQALGAHNFVTGHDFTTHAVEQVLTKNTAYEILGYVTPLAAIALVGGMITLMVSTVRVGLQPRWMGIVGGVGAVILLVPSQELSLITAFWMVATGILLMGRFPNGDPPAWAAGAARPWPSQLEARAARDTKRGGSPAKRPAKEKASEKASASNAVPEPVQPASPAGSSKRRRKRGSRR
jgi:hypothetical protein